MLRVSGPAPDIVPALDRQAYYVVTVLIAVLIAGYVVLTGLGRDTTGYLLLVGGPLVTSVIGSLISRRVAAVAGAVAEVQAATAAVVEDELPALHRHLQVQDKALGTIVVAVSEQTRQADRLAAEAAGEINRLLPEPRPAGDDGPAS